MEWNLKKTTVSTVLAQLEAATSDLKTVQGKIVAFREALKELQGTESELQQAVAQKDLALVAQAVERFKERGQRLQTASEQLQEVLE
jgi:predicted transcriptional regulator